MSEHILREWPARSRNWQSLRISSLRMTRDNTVGLGDVVKDVTSLAGISPCNRCEQRAATLNRIVRLPRFHKWGRS